MDGADIVRCGVLRHANGIGKLCCALSSNEMNILCFDEPVYWGRIILIW